MQTSVFKRKAAFCGAYTTPMKNSLDSRGQASDKHAMMIGVLWMSGCVASFIAMALSSRELADTMPIMQVLLLRSAVGLPVMLILARHLLPELMQLRDLRLHLVRNIVHFSAQYCWTVGIVLLPLAYVFALEFTMPIWVGIFAWMALGERISRARMLAMVVSFIGVLIILRPDAGLDPAALIVLAAAAGYGASAVFVKRLIAHSSPAIIVTWMAIMQLPMAVLMLLITGGWVLPVWGDTPWILVLGLTTLSAHYTMARALRVMDASLAIPIDFLRVPLIAIIGWVFYGEAVGAAVFIGTALIAGANFVAVRAETKAARRR
ncbi:MAG: DMT family transporter [Burkholderiaceae bacterium]